MIQSPCKNCKDRHYKCWGECEEYLEYRRKLEKAKEKEREYKHVLSDIIEIRKAAARRSRQEVHEFK